MGWVRSARVAHALVLLVTWVGCAAAGREQPSGTDERGADTSTIAAGSEAVDTPAGEVAGVEARGPDGRAPSAADETGAAPAAPLAGDEEAPAEGDPSAGGDALTAAPRSSGRATVTSRAVGPLLELTIEPFGVQISVPREHTDHIYRGDSLARVQSCNMEWDREYARVSNAALPFEALAVHMGSGEFCNDGYYRDMHVRVYVLDEPPGVVAAHIVEGAATVTSTPPLRALPQDLSPSGRWAPRTAYDGWRFVPVEYQVFYGDYGGVASHYHFVGRVAGRTVVVLFMFVGSPVYEGDGQRFDPIQTTVESVTAGHASHARAGD